MAENKKKVLVIDDEEDMQVIATEVLKRNGYEAYSARNGQDGLNMAQSVKPDLILLDVMMPLIDGFRLQELLLEDEKTKMIPIVFVTARTALEDTVRAVSKGAVGYIEKPFDVKQLVRKIESLLNPPA